MGKYKYDIINGQMVERNVAKAYRKWAAAFKKETGYDMFVSSGTRPEDVQEKGWRDYLAGRTPIKWAKPTESSHCEVGPSGPRALDIRDSGKDAGVTVKGSARWKIAVRLGKKYGFTWGGWGVPDSEGWHFENHVAKVGVYGTVAKVVATVKKATRPKPWSVVRKWRWAGIADMLRVHYGYVGNDIPGPVMMRAFQRFLSAFGYYTGKIDGIYGDGTAKGHQRWLRRKYKYTGLIDAWMGTGSEAAHYRADKANDAAF